MLSDAELIEIEQRAEAATPGPWFARDGAYGWEVFAADVPADIIVEVALSDGRDGPFIAASRTDVPALIAALREARAERDALREVLHAE